MFTKFLKGLIIITFVSVLLFLFINESDGNKKKQIGESLNIITTFDENTKLYSDEFVNQFKMSYEMNEHWLGILIKKNDIYELHHFSMPVGETYKEYDFDISQASELYICHQHIDYFDGNVTEPDAKFVMTQFQLNNDTSTFETSEVTGNDFTGIIDIYEVDLASIDREICFQYYSGNTKQTPIETWHFNLKI
ncbi:hypothetical protein KHM83_17190 [Fusibacter paucivorans]|uniref:Uncharacterized protein n=1 Tax=Fusibacter paucivorans TaxID=76009 RepID=A0ABS5PTC4_9FIRM|nr:hypothetical protein [Fusibacter paucivorans]MBS7528425.1 hypothetical protein [Fusibacter paucivorans]